MPTELDRKIRNRFDELIEEVEILLAELNEYDEAHYLRYREWQVKSSGLLTQVFGNSAERQKYVKIVEANPGPISWSSRSGTSRKLILASKVKRTIATLKGISDNYVNGFYIGLDKLIIANVSADYMEQAEALLDAGYFVPAAVLCGAVLENRLRGYCEKHDPPIETNKPNGESKTLGALIGELDRIKAFDKQTRKMLKAWADIRNAAAHGRDQDFTREQVELMLLGVNGFLANHL